MILVGRQRHRQIDDYKKVRQTSLQKKDKHYKLVRREEYWRIRGQTDGITSVDRQIDRQKGR